MGWLSGRGGRQRGQGAALDPKSRRCRALLPGPRCGPDRTGSTRSEAIVDGEVVALDEAGRPSFALLQARAGFQQRRDVSVPIVYQVFDLLFLDGESMLDLPLDARKVRLRERPARPPARPLRRAHRGRRRSPSSPRSRRKGSRASWPSDGRAGTSPDAGRMPGSRSRTDRSRSSSSPAGSRAASRTGTWARSCSASTTTRVGSGSRARSAAGSMPGRGAT